MPELAGEVSWQEVAFEDVQLYEYESPSVIVIWPSEPLALMSTVTMVSARAPIGKLAPKTNTIMCMARKRVKNL